jgi:hypothetical protein
MSARGHQVLSFSIMSEIATGTLVAAKSRTLRGENREAKDVEGVENLVIARMVSRYRQPRMVAEACPHYSPTYSAHNLPL